MKLLKIFLNTFAVLQFILHQTESMAPIQSEDAQVPSCVKIKEQIKAFEGAGWSEWASSDLCSPTFGSGRFVFRKLCCEGDTYDCKRVNGGLRIYETQSEPFEITDDCQKTADEVYSPWSVWSVWGDCPEVCGESTTKTIRRTRTCTRTNEGLGEGLGECLSPLTETQTQCCGLNGCPVNGGYTHWSDWSLVPCNETCEANVTSVRTRFRSCTNPVPNHGGRSCTGPSFETSLGSLDACPVDGVLSIWSAWTNPSCPVSCGASATKMRIKTRTCTPPPQNGGKECTGNLFEAYEVYCGLNDCPVDGGYAAWSQWSLVPCSATCGINATTVRTRSRTCTNPVPNHGGAPCSGPSFDTSSFTCGLNSCRVDGGYAAWSQWSLVPCSATCGINATTVRTRSRTCTNPVPNHGGAPCSGPSFDTSSFPCGLNSCRVDGGYAAWSQWSLVPCSATCGINATTVRTRSRTCTNPVPNHGGAPCSGPSFDTSSFLCGLNSCRVDGGYAAWSQWSLVPCSATCGINATTVRTRSRTCTNPVPNHGGAPCSGPSFDTSSFPCGPSTDPVDGVISTWSVWSNPPCSVTCGASATKTRSRTRTCTPPMNGGEDCSGILTETLSQNCFLCECQVDGGYAPWSEWSLFPCSETCGINVTTVRTRSRTCTNPVPQYGGALCQGLSFETGQVACTPEPSSGINIYKYRKLTILLDKATLNFISKK